MSLSAPTQLTLGFAENGTKNTIPNASQIGITPGAASFNDGFPPLTRQPVAAGGVPPFGEDMNGVLYALSKDIQWEQAGGRYPFSSAFATAVGGYPLSAIVQASDGTGSWLNTTANNSNDPEAVAAPNGWQPVGKRGITSIALSNANVTLTNLQSANETIVFTGTLTANVVVTVAQFVKDFKFVNQTSGAFTVSVKTAAGAALIAPQGGRLDTYGDGTTINVASSAIAGGVVGSARNLRAYLAAAGTSLTFTADEVIVETALGGVRTALANFNQTVATGTSGIGGVVGAALTANGYAAIYAAYNPTTGAQGAFIVNANALAPNIAATPPAGWVSTGLISVWPLNASTQFVQGLQADRLISRIGTSVLSTSSGTGAVWTSLSISSAVPVNAKRINGTIGAQTNSTASATTSLFVAGDVNGVGAQQTYLGLTSSSGSNVGGDFGDIPLATAQTMYYQAINTAGSPSFTININGYTI